jgi:hypothetical protein
MVCPIFCTSGLLVWRSFPPIGKIAKISQHFFDGENLSLVQIAGLFLGLYNMKKNFGG